MAAQDRPAPSGISLADALTLKPSSFDFFQAMRRLECAHPSRPRFGCSARPDRDPLRLGQDPSLAFAPSTLASYRPELAEGPARLAGYFLGLFGPNGPLPLHLTDYAIERLRHAHDPTLIAFADVFHHRMLSLFYRAWSLSRPTVSFDRPEEDWFSRYLASLFGFGLPALCNRDALPDRAKLYYAGLLADHTRHPDGLRMILADYFGMPVRIEEFVGAWLLLPVASRCRLGVSPETARLGSTAVAGYWVWSGQSRFRVVFGALALAEYQRFLPARASARAADRNGADLRRRRTGVGAEPGSDRERGAAADARWLQFAWGGPVGFLRPSGAMPTISSLRRRGSTDDRLTEKGGAGNAGDQSRGAVRQA